MINESLVKFHSRPTDWHYG